MRETNDIRSARTLWAGRLVAALPVLFLLFDASIKLARIQPVIDSFQRLGYDANIAPLIGLLQLAFLGVYLVPRTAVIGAVLLTGFLGGAVATQVRVGSPLFSHVLFPVYVALPLWAGLYMRDARLRVVLASRAGLES